MEPSRSPGPDRPPRELSLRWLAEQDHVWLRALIDEYDRFTGRRRRELDQRLREPLACPAPQAKLKLAIDVLDRVYAARVQAVVRPPSARALVFGLAAASPSRGDARLAEVMSAAASELGVAHGDLAEALFADVPEERRVVAPETAVAPGEVALRANLLTVQRLLRRSYLVNIRLEGQARAVVRHAKWRGLICTVRPTGELTPAMPAAVRAGDAVRPYGTVLSISGPFSLFARTLVYGRALAELVPHLALCSRYRLEARVELSGEQRLITISTGDPIWPARTTRIFDSRLEERFARDFRKAAPGVDLIREPEPVRAGGTLIFPDFALVPRDRPDAMWFLEIIGYWTREYLVRKLEHLRAAGIRRLILCVDDERNCGASDLPAGAVMIRYRRRIDPGAVLRIMGMEPAAPEVVRTARRADRRPSARMKRVR